jgi:hypothetical protein
MREKKRIKHEYYLESLELDDYREESFGIAIAYENWANLKSETHYRKAASCVVN